MEKYKVLRDTREQQGWDFPAKDLCLGTVDATLKTGDYTLDGYENVFVIERKMSTGEISQNIVQSRFERELQRLESFAYPFLVCEFTLEDVINFPHNSGIPRSRWSTLRISPQFLLKRLNEFQIRYRTRFIFAGQMGREFASSLFKRVIENVKQAD
jgi:hypothetical protein